MRKKKPFRILEERIEYNYIVIELFRRWKIFSFGLSTSIGDGDIGHPEQGTYRSYFEAKNAALHHVIDWKAWSIPRRTFGSRFLRKIYNP